MCNNAVMAAAFDINPAKARDLWNPPVTDQTNHLLPRLIYLPTEISAFVVETPQTPWEVHTFVSRMVTRVHNPIPRNMHSWCSNVYGDHTSGVKKNGIRMDSQGSISGQCRPSLCRMVFYRVNSTIGDSPPATPVPHHEGQATTILTSIEKWPLWLTSSRFPRRLGQRGATSSKSTPYSDYTVAVYSRICHAMHLPPIWSLFQNTKAMEHHRLNLQQRMNTWVKKEGIEIDSGVFFLKDTIKDSVELQLIPAKGYASLRTAEKVVSILTCLP